MPSRRLLIAVRFLSLRQPDSSTRQAFVWNQAQKVRYAVELSAPLVVPHHDIPGRNFGISCGEHLIPRARVVPPTMGFEVIGLSFQTLRPS